MSAITREKLGQSVELLRRSGLDVWLTFVRETVEGCDPALPLILEAGLTWQSALMVFPSGKKIAVVGNFDAEPLKATGDWDSVVPYVQGIKDQLLEVLEREIATAKPRIGVNYSTDDSKADGLSHGLFMLLSSYLQGTRFADSLESAESVVTRLRAQKTPAEVALIRAAIAETEQLIEEIEAFTHIGVTEDAVQSFAHSRISQRGLGFAWEQLSNPIVNSGPDSMIGHGRPSPHIRVQTGHIFHVDIGVIRDGYASDIQRSWFVGSEIPEDVQRAFTAVRGAITAGAEALKVGVQGWQVDQAAREFLVGQGYPEYQHAFGHQVGRVAHDGGAVLGPKWDRYGRTPNIPIAENEVYTLELGVMVEGRGYLGIEEMVCVGAEGLEWLTARQETLGVIGT
jgi:Xaa-Pro aminopeptidase